MTIAEKRYWPAFFNGEIRRNAEVWREVEEQAIRFVNSLPYLILAKGGKIETGISLNLGGEEKIFSVVGQEGHEGRVWLYLQQEESAPEECLALTLEPTGRPSDFKLVWAGLTGPKTK